MGGSLRHAAVLCACIVAACGLCAVLCSALPVVEGMGIDETTNGASLKGVRDVVDACAAKVRGGELEAAADAANNALRVLRPPARDGDGAPTEGSDAAELESGLLACLGGVSMARGNATAAEGYFADAAQLQPRNAAHAVARALALLELQRMDEAVDVLRSASALEDPGAVEGGSASSTGGKAADVVEAGLLLASVLANRGDGRGAVLEAKQAAVAAASTARAEREALVDATARGIHAGAFRELAATHRRVGRHDDVLDVLQRGAARHLLVKLQLATSLAPIVPSTAADQTRMRREALDAVRSTAAFLDSNPLPEDWEDASPLVVTGDAGRHHFFDGAPADELLELRAATTGVLRRAFPTALGGDAPVDASVAQAPGNARQIRVGFVYAGTPAPDASAIAVALVSHLPRPEFHVTVIHPEMWEGRPVDPGSVALLVDAADDFIIPAVDDKRNGDLFGFIREKVTAGRFDSVVFVELGVDLATYLAAFSRMAPVQLALAGLPTSTGIADSVDYFVSYDAAEPSSAATAYSEQLVRLSALHSTVPARKTVAAGVPRWKPVKTCRARAHQYVVMEPALQLHEAFDETLLGILEADGCGRITFVGDAAGLADPLLERLNATGRLTESIEARMSFKLVPPSELSNVAAQADLVVDTLPIGGRQSVANVLAAGTPVVTARSPDVRGRYAAALLSDAGLAQHIAASGDAKKLARLAVSVASNLREERPAVRAAASSASEGAYAEEVAALLRRAVAAHRMSLQHA